MFEGPIGVGGPGGTNSEGIVAREDMMATRNVMEGISFGVDTSSGVMTWPRAAPNGLARDAIAVADTRPAGVNQRSE